ncbi:tetratricopeptide repeat protein [Leeuwenhoekiella sp. NPDC079379]|uniref:tetratricopeptide repeat protein n=1 Tax=Leeuwenhoekiella sp. NPDC079379 TaxID=3364122 RepID=UPI0037CB925E
MRTLLLITLLCIMAPYALIQAQSIDKSFQHFSDSLFYVYKLELDTALKQSDRNKIVEAYLNRASLYKQSQIYTEAVENYSLAYRYSSKTANKTKSCIKNNLGEIYILLNNYTKALQYLKEAFEIASENNLSIEKAKSLRLIGTCKEKLGEPHVALTYQNRSYAIYNEQNDLYGQAIVNENLGSIYEDLKMYDKAYSHFEKAFVYFKNTNDESQINALNNLADIYRKTQDYTNALIKTTAALNLAQQYDNSHQIQSAYKDLSKTYILKNDFEKGYHYLSKYQKRVEQQFYSQNFNQLNALQTIFDTKEKQAQINLLEAKNKTAKANLVILILLTLVAVVSCVLVLYIQKRRRSLIAKIHAYKQRALEAEIEHKVAQEQYLQNEIQLKTATLSKYSLSISQKNKLIEEVSGTLQKLSSRKRMDLPVKLEALSKELDLHLAEDNEWNQFMVLFEEIHPHFTKNLSEVTLHKLTATELRLCLLLRLNLSSKEIASILRITADSVRVARYRLRKKLPIDTQEELVNFMLKL